MAAYIKDGMSNSDSVNEVMVCDTTLFLEQRTENREEWVLVWKKIKNRKN